jgi:hypothetical protein
MSLTRRELLEKSFELLPSPLDQRFRNISECASVLVGELF